MWKPIHSFSLLCLLSITALCGQGAEINETWSCLCGSSGLTGTQFYTGNEDLGFTECRCPSAPLQGCQVCPVGQLLNPLLDETMACSCTDPLFVIIQLLQQRLQNYTQSLENAFKNDLATFLKLSPSQIFLGARRNGSVILDVYIFTSQRQQPSSLENVRNLLLQRNNTLNHASWGSLIGPWKMLYLANIPSDTELSEGESPRKDLGRKLFLVALVLCATVAVVLLFSSLMFLVYKKVWSLRYPPVLWFEDDNSSTNGFRTLLSHHHSGSMEMYQVYDNTCFSGTGCTGKISFKMNTKIGSVIGIVVRRFTFSELEEAAGWFSKSNVIGVGGSSIVYKGCLKDGRQVAIKRLNQKCGSSLEREFLQEVELLSRLHHFHLVPLFGYCIEAYGNDLERLLVYEYMPNGNLREHLNQSLRKESLDWEARLKIALGAARGLEYLHESANPRVLHRDFKSSNILLDSNWRAKVADFGMATVVKEIDVNTCPSSPAQMLGTFGYFAPEYAMMGRATIKSDVFSFGVVLLELITGRKPLERSLPLGQESLVVWALPLLRDKSRILDELIDPTLQLDSSIIDDAWRMAYLAWLCLQMDPESRPTMTFVVQVLATMIPENCMQMTEFEPLMEARDKVPRLLSWTQGHSFSRDNHSSNILRLDHSCPTLLIQDNDQQGSTHVTKKSLDSTSISATECLERFSAMAPLDMARKSLDEEADLVKPRLESFWQNNGFLIHEKSPTR